MPQKMVRRRKTILLRAKCGVRGWRVEVARAIFLPPFSNRIFGII